MLATVAFVLLYFVGDHDAPVAFYEIRLDYEPVEFLLDVEEQNLQAAINDKEPSRKDIQRYLNQHISISINGKNNRICLDDVIDLNQGHLKIVGRLSRKSPEILGTIEIENTAFLDTNLDMINSVSIYNADGKPRGFKMNAKRASISASY